MNKNRTIEKIFNPIYIELLIFIILLLSVPHSIKFRLFKHICTALLSVLFVYITTARILFFRHDRSRRRELRLSIDEYLISAICAIGILSGIFYHHDILNAIFAPLGFFISYIGLSSYAKIVDISEKLLIRILLFIITIILIHTIFEYSASITTLIDYLTGKINYHHYVWNSWNLLYPNYNYFSRNVMIGFMCSLSLYLYCTIKGEHVRIKNFAFFMTLFNGITVLMLFARTAILTVTVYGAMLLTYVFMFHRDIIIKRITVKKAVITVLVSALCLYFLLSNDFIDAVIMKTRNQGSTFRFGMWNAFIHKEIELFPDLRFFIGHGYKNIQTPFYEIWRDFNGKHVHNNFLFIWYNYGFISMILFMSLLVKMLVSSVKVIRKIWFVFFLPVGYLCVAAFESMLVRHSFRLEVIFFFLFLILSCNFYLKAGKSVHALAGES